MAPRFAPARILALATAASGLAATLLLHGCEGSATQTTTGPGLHGTLVDVHGQPVRGAQLMAWPAGSGPNGLPNRPDSLAAPWAETDGEGRYSLTDLEPGVYNLYGLSRQGDASVLIPRVKYLETAVDLGADTLAPNGSITGKVLSEGAPLTPAFCYLQGSTFVALTDSAGAFALERIPAGTYRLNYVAQGYAAQTDSPVVVLPGQAVSLAPRNLDRDLDGQPPAARILEAVYDSVEGMVRIAWNAPQVADLNGYYVESFPLGADSQAFDSRRHVWDTVLNDPLGREFGSGFSADADPDEVEEVTWVYRIRSVDWDGNVSRVPADPIVIKVTRPEILRYSISLRVAEGDRDTVLCQDSLVLIVDLDQPSKGPVSASWLMNAWYGSEFRGIPLKNGAVHPLPDTLVWKWNPEWEFGFGAPARLDSLQFKVATGPARDASGDERHIKIRGRPDGCYAVERSRPPSFRREGDEIIPED